jgi:hypothetical protein
VTALLVLGTAFLALFTFNLWQTTNAGAVEAANASTKALEASTKATETLVKIERPYLTGGGPVGLNAAGERIFRAEVANYGKTPAYLHAFDVCFGTLKEVQDGPQDVFPWRPFDDRIAAGGLKHLAYIKVPDNAEVVFGGFWYQDWLKQEHVFRFILRIEKNGDTHTDIADVDDSYRYWD